jgi:hypothetical protein
MGTPKQKIIDGVSAIFSSFTQPIFGGDTSFPPGDPNRDGHKHDGGPNWGSVQQIDLGLHTTGRLILQDQYSVIKTTSLPSSAGAVLGNSIVWYFTMPTDLDQSKTPYFSFGWQGDPTDGYNNITSTLPQTTVFQITWQWYVPGYAILAPAVIYDGQPPANQAGSNINSNSLTRGRIPNFTVNTAPFQLLINDSATGNQNYVSLVGLNQAQNSVIIGVQVQVLNTGFSNGVIFFNGNLVYLSKTIGGANTGLTTL